MLYLKPLEARKLTMKNKTVVYTAVTGGYDLVLPTSFNNCDFVCFTDQQMSVRGWDVRKLPFQGGDNVRTARAIKILPHRLFDEYETSIWVDGNVTIIRDPYYLLRQLDCTFALHTFKHSERDSLTEELHACIRLSKDDKSVMERQVQEYLAEGCPDRGNLIESGILIRHHGDSQLIDAMELWWQQIQIYSRRDQLSFPYVVWKTGLKYGVMGEAHARGRSKYFFVKPHNKQGNGRRFRNKLSQKKRYAQNYIRNIFSKY